MLVRDGKMKISVSISSLSVFAFLINLNTLNILKVRITDVADPMSTVTILANRGYCMMIPMSVPTTTMKSNVFHWSLNYSPHNAICLMTYSALNIMAKTKLAWSKIRSVSGSGGNILSAITKVFTRMHNVINESNTLFLLTRHNKFLNWSSGGFNKYSGVFFKNSFCISTHVLCSADNSLIPPNSSLIMLKLSMITPTNKFKMNMLPITIHDTK